MAGLLQRTRLALDNCKEHLSSLPSQNPDVENYLTQHILVLLCAEVQQAIYSTLDDRTKITGDAEVQSFASFAGRRVVRGVEKTELAGFIGMFGEEKKNQFATLLAEEDVTIYGNAVSSRHKIAHNTQGANITFRELEKAVDAACKMINAAREALGLNRIDPAQ